jgi:hypothetical protein
MNEIKTHITLKAGEWYASDKADEPNVHGRFLLQDELKAAKSKKAKKPIYEPIKVCQIKILHAANGDIVSHALVEGDAKSEALKTRFKTAYEAFIKLIEAESWGEGRQDGAAPKGEGDKTDKE